MIERDYPNTYKKFTALGPLMAKVGNGGKGIAWNTEHEVEQLGELNEAVTDDGITQGMPRIETDIDASEVILMLAPETNGEVAVKAWKALSKKTGREHAHLARTEGGRETPLPRHAGAAAQDHFQPDLERHRVGEGQLQRRLDQHQRADSLAHPNRAPAVLPGPQMDAGLRRRPVACIARRSI